MGDFNSHHFAWSSDWCNGNGKIISKSFQDRNLVIFNDGSPPRLNPPNENRTLLDRTNISNLLAFSFPLHISVL